MGAAKEQVRVDKMRQDNFICACEVYIIEEDCSVCMRRFMWTKLVVAFPHYTMVAVFQATHSHLFRNEFTNTKCKVTMHMLILNRGI
jgi:hypothetical protein